MTNRTPRYDSDGDGILDAELHATVNNNRIVDTSGQPLGELTGSGDAQTIIDAINNRTAGTSLVIPDPGFALDWEQQVDLPAQEQGFSIHTFGTPQCTINSSFSDNVCLRVPGGTSGTLFDDRNYYIDSLYFDNNSNNVSGIDWAIEVIDKRQMIINSPLIRSIPGIHLDASNRFTSDVMILNGITEGTRGPAIQCENNANANYIYNHAFSESNNTETETGFIDKGNHNRWINSRCEFAHTVHKADGAKGYFIRNGDWDRPNSSFTYSLIEQNGATGHVYLTGNNKGENFDRMLIQSPKTTVEQPGIQLADYGRGVTDYGTGLNRLYRGPNFPDDYHGWTSSGGGSVSTGGIFGAGIPLVQLSTSSSGQAINLHTHGNFVDHSIRPAKAVIGRVPSAPSNSGMSVQIGFADGVGTDPTNRAELVYDPSDNIGTFTRGNTNWWLDVKTAGTERSSTDLGIDATNNTNWLSVNLDPQNGEVHGSAAAGTHSTISDGGSPIPEAFYRIRVGDFSVGGLTQNVDLQEGFTLITV